MVQLSLNIPNTCRIHSLVVDYFRYLMIYCYVLDQTCHLVQYPSLLLVNTTFGVLGLGHTYSDSAKFKLMLMNCIHGYTHSWELLNSLHTVMHILSLSISYSYSHTHTNTQVLLLMHTCTWLCNRFDYTESQHPKKHVHTPTHCTVTHARTHHTDTHTHTHTHTHTPWHTFLIVS